jgi:hypothetical protein
MLFLEQVRLSLHLALVSILMVSQTARSQADTTSKPEITYSGFADGYYVYDFSEPPAASRQPFLYNHNRHNEFNLNLGLIKVSVKDAQYRGSFALQAGTYVNDNYAAEPGSLKFINEGNAGITINRKRNLWLDAGIFSSHIGFESAISKENWTLTRSINAENSPYYLAGGKLTYYPNTKWELALWVCNGWQRIAKVAGNSLPGYCTHIKYTSEKNFIFNWSTFAGTDDPDVYRRVRYFSNMYVQWPVTAKLGIIAAFDIGAQQSAKGSSTYHTWYSPVLKCRYAINKQWSSTLRLEYYNDKDGVIINYSTPHGFQTSGVSINLDYAPSKNVVFRIEPKWLNSVDKIFVMNKSAVNDNFSIASSIAVSF